MKEAIKIVALIIALGTLVSSCKKGEDDPFISFRSRKARVAGDWELKSGTSTSSSSSQSGNNTFSNSSSTTYNGTTYSESYTSSYNGNSNTTTNSGSYTSKVSFKKDGTFEWQMTQDGNLAILKGTWNFTGKIGDHKNKEQIVLALTSVVDPSEVTTYSGNQTFLTYDLVELRNTKMVLRSESTESYTGNSQASKDEMTFEQ